MPSVLIVDDLISIQEMLDAVIQPTGFTTSFATDGEKALARYKSEKPDIVLADIDMKPMDGISLLKQIKQMDANAVVVIMTAYASVDSALQALKFGSFDYLQKPFRVDELIATLRRGYEFRQSVAERAAAAVAAAAAAPTGTSVPPIMVAPKVADIDSALVGNSPKFKKLIQQVKKLATVKTPVLLQGESGTGKTTIAEVLHGMVNGPEAPMVRIDCTLSSEENFREGLLGEGGAGGLWIKQAKGGTLFLDQVHELPLTIQKELSGVLRAMAQSFRLICTTSEDLEKRTEEGKFNDELFYRVASLPVVVPPLRERKEDLPLLVKHFASQAVNPFFDASLLEMAEDALEVLQAYDWPANLTEMQQVITKLATTVESRVVTSQELPMRLKELKKWPSLADYLAGQEKQYVERVVRACGNDKMKAAKVLGIDVTKIK